MSFPAPSSLLKYFWLISLESVQSLDIDHILKTKTYELALVLFRVEECIRLGCIAKQLPLMATIFVFKFANKTIWDQVLIERRLFITRRFLKF